MNFFLILIGFIVTFVLELIVSWVLLRKNSSFKEIFFFTILINLFTWPIAQLLYTGSNFLILELGVIIVESILILLLYKTSYARAFVTAFIANFISAIAGKLICF